MSPNWTNDDGSCAPCHDEARGGSPCFIHGATKPRAVRRFKVWREPHPAVDLVEYPSLRTVEVTDSDGPREAAVEWAYAIDLSAETAVRVREQVPGAKVTRWRVEPVTTYRARPA